MKNEIIINNIEAVIKKHSEKLNGIDRLEVCYISNQKPKKILSLLKKGKVKNIKKFDTFKQQKTDTFVIQNSTLTIYESGVDTTPEGRRIALYVCVDTDLFQEVA